MSFMERARALYQRGDAIRAAFLLAEGIKKAPSDEEALRWFLQIYVEDIESPGLEQELIRVLETQPDGPQLLELVTSELGERDQEGRLAFLNRVRQVRERTGSQGSRRASRSPLQTREPGETLSFPPKAPGERKTQAHTGNTSTPRNDHAPRRRRRTQPTPIPAIQGVLPLDTAQTASPRYDWSNFKGLAQGFSPAAGTEGASTPRSGALTPDQAPVAGTVFEVPGAGPPPRTAEPMPANTAGSISVVSRSASDAVDLPEPATRLGPDSEDLPELDTAVFDDSSQPADLVTERIEFEGDLLPFSRDEGWSLGGLAQEAMEAHRPAEPSPRRRRHRRTRRHRAVRIGALAPVVARALLHGARMLVSGRRGVTLLVLVALLGAGGAWYRTCAGIAREQLALADQALQRADGASLRQAVDLYQEYLPDEHTAASEQLDFAQVLLAADYGLPCRQVDYDATGAMGVYGWAAIALAQLTTSDATGLPTLAEEVVTRYPDQWLAHWTRGRIAMAVDDWPRAEESFRQARELDDRAILPVVGLVELSLAVGRDEVVEPLLSTLAELHPEHPLVGVGRAVVSVGLDPLHSRAGILEVALPDPEEESLSQKTRELVLYLRARQALASWRMDDVALAMRQLEALVGDHMSLRAGLLDAVTKARAYRLDETVSALEQVEGAVLPGSPAQLVVQALAAEILLDLGRPDLALERISEDPTNARLALLRAELLVDAGRETEALRLLGHLMDRPATRSQALRILVDFHLRRGAVERARLRSDGLTSPADQAYAAARLALAEQQWEQARQHAETGLHADPLDRETLFLWAEATAHLGLAEQAIERIDQLAARSILLGAFDRARLEVMVISNRAPRDTIVEFLSLLESTQPSSTRTRTTLALAHESIGNLDQARALAEGVLQHEPNNGCMRSLLDRLGSSSHPEEATLVPERTPPVATAYREATDWLAYMLIH